jgi:hypothetical protein
VTSRPCVFHVKNVGKSWSGREDSNLRPLPPEGAAPERIRWFLTVFPERLLSSGGRCSRLFHGRRFGVNLGPCLFGVANA